MSTNLYPVYTHQNQHYQMLLSWFRYVQRKDRKDTVCVLAGLERYQLQALLVTGTLWGVGVGLVM